MGVGGVLHEPQSSSPAQLGDGRRVGADHAADVDEHHAGRLLGEGGLDGGGDSAMVSGSTSASRTRPPACSTAAAVAKNVLAGTITSAPPSAASATRRARKMISRALVPLRGGDGVTAAVAGGERVLELGGVRARG